LGYGHWGFLHEKDYFNMIRSLYRTKDGNINTNLLVPDFALALQDTDGLLWVDLVAEPSEVCKPILQETFGFHSLAVDDALEEVHVPKVDDWGEYLYLVVRAVDSKQEVGTRLETIEVDTFMGRNYVVTYHYKPVEAIERLWMVCQRDQRQLNKDANYLLYRLIDEIASDYIFVAEKIDEAINEVEDKLFENPKPFILEQIFALKRDLLHLHRIIAPQREMVNKLARGDYAVIDTDAKIYFRDVYDHFVRLYDIVENLRDLVGSALETYLSVINNRMNNVMKTLTVITTLFMPISFLASFFGMNFFQPSVPMNVWTGWPAFILLISAMILFPIGMYLWIRQR
jgi:magnesium transporter